MESHAEEKSFRDSEKAAQAYIIDLDTYGQTVYTSGHMNPSGYILLAEFVDSYIDYIVRHNPKDFEMVAFINPPESD